MSDCFLALRVRELMARTGPDGKRWSSRRVAEEATKLGHPITASYVQSLANGERKNPTLSSLRALQAVFGVPMNSLLEPDPDGRDEVASALNTLNRAGADVVLARGAGELSPKTLQVIATALREELGASQD